MRAIYRFDQFWVQSKTKVTVATEAQKPFFFFCRAKYHKLKYGTELLQGDMKAPSYDSGRLEQLLCYSTPHGHFFVLQGQHLRQITGMMKNAPVKEECFFSLLFYSFMTVFGLREKC